MTNFVTIILPNLCCFRWVYLTSIWHCLQGGSKGLLPLGSHQGLGLLLGGFRVPKSY